MKKIFYLSITVALLVIAQSCSTQDESAFSAKKISNFNICLIIDGTDRLSNQNGVPQVTVTDMEDLAKSLSSCGMGTLYVSYVDNDCDNNQVAVFSHELQKPVDPGKKKDYQTLNEYNSIKAEFEALKQAYEDNLENAISQFSADCSRITKLAYSDFVAKQKKGSDVNGAINQASRLLKASLQDCQRAHIILVSDGCDNVGKELKSLPETTELLIVNTNVSKHHYSDLVSHEFVTLRQASNYIFK